MADQQISITLPEETIRSMQARVDAGEYPSLRELILHRVDQSFASAVEEDLDPRYFGEDFETYLAANRELILRESEDWENMIPAEEVFASLQREREAQAIPR